MTKHHLEQETPAWLAGLSDTLLFCLISGQLWLPEAMAGMDVAQ